MKSTRICSILSALAITGLATAETLEIDLFAEGVVSEGLPLAVKEHFTLSYDLGVGTTINSVAWSLNREAYDPSYLSEMVISVRNADASTGFVTVQEGPTTFGVDMITGSSTKSEILTTGELLIRFYESFDDSFVDPDGVYLEGSTLTIEYTPTCFGDLNGDGLRTFADLTRILSAWGLCPGCPEDLDGSGHIGFNDLTIHLNAWGPCPEP